MLKIPDKLRVWEFADAIPVLRNGIFKFKSRLSEVWTHPDFSKLGSLVDPGTNKFYTNAQVVALAEIHFPGKSQGQRRYIAAAARKIQEAMGSDLRGMLTQGRTQIDSGEIVTFSDDDGVPQYGKRRGNELWVLRVDDSGYSEPVSEPYVIGNGEDEIPEESLGRVSRWGEERGDSHPIPFRPPLPVVGPMAATYPQDWGWTIFGKPDILRLSQLSIRRLTIGARKEEVRPNCEAAWEKRLAGWLQQRSLPWDLIWKGMGTFLTSPRDEKTWHRLLHRALFTRNQDPKARVKECRLKCPCRVVYS